MPPPRLLQLALLLVARGAALPEFTAVVGSGSEKNDAGAAQSVELLRFVTAYKTGIEALVDLTPFSPLLKAASESGGNLSFYAFIDTWVDNSTGQDIVYESNTTGKCFPSKQSNGNGWQLFGKLVFWPKEAAAVDTRPRESLTLASGMHGSNYRIGEVALADGNITKDGTSVLLGEKEDLARFAEAGVYACPGGAQDLHDAATAGFLEEEMEWALRNNDSDAAEDIADSILQTLVMSRMTQVSVADVGDGGLVFAYVADTDAVQLETGLHVFIPDGEVFTDWFYNGSTRGFWVNRSLPFEAVGEVRNVSGKNMTLKLNHTCLPSAALHGLPGLLIPNNALVIPDAKRLVANVSRRARAGAAKKGLISAAAASVLTEYVAAVPAASASRMPTLLGRVRGGELAPLVPLGSVDLAGQGRSEAVAVSAVALASSVKVAVGRRRGLGAARLMQRDRSDLRRSGKRVCVVASQKSGRLFERTVSLSPRAAERTLLQLAVTGHGWAATSSQCGEYCHAVYRLGLNNQSVANVTQWRDDCKDNPTGKKQHGTWYESRNGWCPGSVNPGVYIDVSEWMRHGLNHLTVDVVVWNNRTERYEAYTDYASFATGDQASLIVGLSLFVYGNAAVEAVLGQDRAYTAAEAALRNGSSHPASLRPPRRPRSAVLPATLLAINEQAAVREPRPGGLAKESQYHDPNGPPDPAAKRGRSQHVRPSQRQTRQRLLRPSESTPSAYSLASAEDGKEEAYDAEARAPWYFYNSSLEGSPVDTGVVNARMADALPPAPARWSGTWGVDLFGVGGRLMQASSRTVVTNVSAEAFRGQEDWGRVALLFRLAEPSGLVFDHWDRHGSVGLLLGGDSGAAIGAVQLRPSGGEAPRAGARRWPILP